MDRNDDATIDPKGGTDQQPLAGRREWLGLAVLCLPTMLAMLDIGVLFLALPELTTDLEAGAGQQLWISDVYGFLIAGFLLTMGTLGDRIGRRRLLLGGAAAFGVISVVAAFSSTPEMLILCRALLGVAGAAIMPTTLALIMDMFRDPRQRGAAIGVWATALTAGVALGPIVGGVLLQWFWWGSVFLIAVPVMVALLVAGPVLLPSSVPAARARRIDVVSVGLSLAAILPFTYGFKEIARGGVTALSVAAIVLGVACAAAFIVRQRTLTDPLVDLSLFAIRAVSGALLLGLLVAGVQGGTGFFVAQFLQVVAGLDPMAAGLWMLAPTVALILGIFISQGIAQKVRPAYVIAGSTLLAAAGMVVLTQVSAGAGLLVLFVGFTMVYVGVSPVGPLVGQIVVPAAPPAKAGSAAALQTTSGELGVALGIAVLGSIGSAVYQRSVALPAEIVGTPAAAAAQETVSGALATATGLPGAVGTALADSARVAFTSGLNTAATVSAVVFVGLAVIAVVTLRHLPPITPPGPGGPGGPEAPQSGNPPVEPPATASSGATGPEADRAVVPTT